MNSKRRLAKLDRRVRKQGEKIAAIELALKNSKSKLNYIVSTWQSVILQFAADYGIESPELQALSKEFKQKEAHL